MENEPASTISLRRPARLLPSVEIWVGVAAATLLAGVSGRAATQEVGEVTRAVPPAPSVVRNASPLYRDATETHLPAGDLEGLSMDAGIGDLDGDGDPDVLIANEHRPNILLLNHGSGHFSNASDRIPQVARDSEDVGFGDVDGDGDLDLLFANVRAFVRDGDLDVVTSNSTVDLDAGRIDPAPYRVYLNDGDGRFAEATERVFPAEVVGVGFDVEAADVDGDGLRDLYLASRGTADRLLLGVATAGD